MPNAALQEFRDFFAGLDPKQFDMSVWRQRDQYNADKTDFTGEVSCGTTACIGGWMNHYFHKSDDLEDRYVRLGARVGLTPRESETLFFMTDSLHHDYQEIDHATALAHLDHILAGNSPDWGLILDGVSTGLEGVSSDV